MKSTFSKLLFASALVASANAMAIPVLPSGPLFIQYVNAEQLSVSNSITSTTAGGAVVNEGNWGIMQITLIQKGTAVGLPGSDIQGGGGAVFADGLPGMGQITGIFYGIQIDPTNPTRGTGGKIDLYWQESSTANIGTELSSGLNLSKRTAQNQYTGFTSGTFLLQLDFAVGCEPTHAYTVCTALDPTTTDGAAKSYQNVNLAAGGAWATMFDTNYFTLDANNNPLSPAADIRSDSNYNHNGGIAWSVANTDIIGLRSNDPIRAVAIPEPGTIALLGLGLLGYGFSIRRSRKQKS